MNKIVTYLNFLGILALALLCGNQWAVNSRLNADLAAMQNKADAQAAESAKQADTIKQNTADLDDLHERLTVAETQLHQNQTELTKVRAERDQAKAEQAQLLEQRQRFADAVTQRDQLIAQQNDAIRKQADSIHQLQSARDDAVKRFNDLVVQYNQQKQQ
jgi:chromosome segregation ATPase